MLAEPLLRRGLGSALGAAVAGAGWSSALAAVFGCCSSSTSASRSSRCGRVGARTRPGPPTPSWCSAPPSTTAGPRPLLAARLDHALEPVAARATRRRDRRHRRQAARRPLHRGAVRGRLPERAGACPTRPSCGRSRAATRGSRWPRGPVPPPDGLRLGDARVRPVSTLRAARASPTRWASTALHRRPPTPARCTGSPRSSHMVREAAAWPAHRSSAATGSPAGLSSACTRAAERTPLASIAALRGWCNRQHSRFWSCLFGVRVLSPEQRPASGRVVLSRLVARAASQHGPIV